MTAGEMARLERLVNELREERMRDWRHFRENEFHPMCERNDAAHDRIEAQTTATNSRVGKLERWQSEWRGAAKAGNAMWIAIGVLLAIVSAGGIDGVVALFHSLGH